MKLKKNMKQLFYLLAILIISLNFISCSICSIINDHFGYLYDGKYTGIDTLIDINGYYHILSGASAPSYIMFYRDGTFASDIFKFKSNNGDEYSIGKIWSWGSYIINNDTIKANAIFD